MSVHRRVLSARAKASATAVATGIGAAFAAGAFATPAVAADDPWATVRQCESGGNYSINTGNGFYGAYQFTLQSWHGLGMSGLPSDAPPAVQDQAARRLAGQYGMKPWPVCGKRYGGRAPTGGGVHHVHPHAPSAPSAVRLPSRTSRTASSHRVHTKHPVASAASTHHADPSRQTHWTRHTYRHSDPPAGHPHYAAASSHRAGRVLSIRLVRQTRADVRLYQLALDRVGYHLVPDGRFGRHTKAATMHFQAAHGLVVDGLAGSHTKAALLRALAQH